MERNLGKVFLSTEVVNALIGELAQVDTEAEELLSELEDLKNTFERIEQVASLISKAVNIVLKFV